MSRQKYSLAVLLLMLLFFSSFAHAAVYLKPFILASTATGSMDEQVAQVKQTLQAGGFEIAGEYSPYDNAYIIVVTNAAIKQAAAKSKNGGYAAAMRVALTKRGND
ncbi:MAG: hypothetical protein R3240_00945, partial [Gammaproteobacteria bacterium]|nr:hypothetical protein [Gammaproteobacteria bacterium]